MVHRPGSTRSDREGSCSKIERRTILGTYPELEIVWMFEGLVFNLRTVHLCMQSE